MHQNGDTPKVALITGGASGIGLAVATELVNVRGNWHVHLIDLDAERGNEAATFLGQCASFHKADITSYSSLASTFDKIFNREGRLDFVFANAGIVERWNFYGTHPSGGPPPEPDLLTANVNLRCVITTAYLAQHYFRQSPGKVDRSLVMTASCGSIYPAAFSPIYSAAKHGVVGLVRSIGKHFYVNDGIRVNCICPGTVKTNILDSREWSLFPDAYFTPIEKVVEVVLMLVDGGDMADTKGAKVTSQKAWARAVEVSGKNHYFQEQPKYSDKLMESLMGEAADIESQIGVELIKA